ncbi:MAG: hypothetical protein AB1344_03060 [Pseudomonadota bacterium]
MDTQEPKPKALWHVVAWIVPRVTASRLPRWFKTALTEFFYLRPVKALWYTRGAVQPFLTLPARLQA